MEDCSVDYLTRIPDELKIAIFSYLDTFDVMQLYDVSESFQHITFDKDIIGKIRLFKEYRFKKDHLNNFILNSVRAETITSLNINCIYWIPAVELRKCVSKLRLLECLYVVDTALSLTELDCGAYLTLPNLKAIALTVVENSISNYVRLPETIINLYMHLEFRTSTHLLFLSILLSKLKNLQTLWVIDFSSKLLMDVVMKSLSRIPRPLEKVTFTFHLHHMVQISSNLCCPLVTMFKNTQERGQICLEKCDMEVNHIYDLWNYQDPNWDTLINRLKCDYPFGQSDAKKLILKQATFEDMHFTELNMTHTAILCSKLLKFTLGNLLVSPNMRLLKKLSINICLCEQYSDEVTKSEPLFKRARVGIGTTLPNQSILEKIVENSPLIKELEIWDCKSPEKNLPQITHAALGSIQNLKQLKKLTLHGVPPHLTGKYLIDICKGCTKLESLRIQTSKQNNNLNNYLCLALPHTTALKDLRYEQCYIPIDKIINSLNSITNSRIQRVVLKCQTIEKFSVLPLETFVLTNSQLRFLCIIISQMPKTVIREISKSIKKCQYTPEKVFIVTQDETTYSGRAPIPHVHKIEMLNCHTWVSVLDIFNGFDKNY